MQPREWVMLALLILIPLAIAAVVTLWSIKQMAYSPRKASPPKPVLSPDELSAVAGGGNQAADPPQAQAGSSRSDGQDAFGMEAGRALDSRAAEHGRDPV